MKKHKTTITYIALAIMLFLALVSYFNSAEGCDTRQGHTCSIIEIKGGK